MVITDLVWGTDQIDVPTVPAAVSTSRHCRREQLDRSSVQRDRFGRQRFASNESAAQFTFSGSTYLVVNEAGAGFADADDILLNVTGVTGQIGTSSFT